MNGKERSIGEPGLTGGFAGGVGTFSATDTDGGARWADTWFMSWTRA